MSFHFVDSSAASTPGARRAIRRHVMKGKNLGKRIQGRGRKNAPPPADGFFGDVHRPREEDREIIEAAEGALARQDRSQLLFPEIAAVDIPPSSNAFAGGEFGYFSFPVQFTPAMRYLVYQFLHCLLAMTATYLTLFHKPGSETLEATRHFSQTLRLINRKLSNPSIPGDSTIAVVVSLTIHGNLSRNISRSLIHFDGLQRLLVLRPGGLASLRDSNHSLMQKVCRTDIDIALSRGTATRFGALGVATSTLVGKTLRPLTYPLNQTCVLLREVTQEMMAFCRRPGRTKISALEYQDLLIWLWQKLLDFAPLREERPQSPLDDVWHLGLLAFLATVAHPVECLRDIHASLLHEMLRDRVERDVLSSAGADYSRLRFWLVMMCELLASDQPEMRLRSQFKALASELGLASWEDAKTSLQSLPWIGVVHAKPGKEAWDSIMCPEIST
ncbi:hypothetical protein AK830_g8112 [Neonectria ditissima]|uniref:Transcription factor domain-containing protein n=1 Tax=Neonectria ditissima TaxID=78410 RepID=A0A0P7B8U4_9HYPO|nr:hypothetical protein AK830_g8112 [Neonectria ditissima]